jgi:hypothetical protein
MGETIVVFKESKKVYAYGTHITPENSMMAIKRLIKKYDCKGWLEAEHPLTKETIIQFQIPIGDDLKTVQFQLRKVFIENSRGRRYLEKESYRLLFLIIKSKILLSQHTSFLEVFMPNLLLEDNLTLIDKLKSGENLDRLLPETTGDISG